jgi:hypothetical protein
MAALEEPSTMPQWEKSGLERTGSRDPGHEGNRGSMSWERVTLEVQAIAALLDLGGADKAR